MKPKVTIIKCSTYNQSEVDAAIEECLKPLGGIEKFVFTGQKVLIKPNLLMERPPEDCVTTHPSIIRSLIKQIKKAGGIPFVGDSPGAAIRGTEKILEVSGIREAVLNEGGKIVNFESGGIKKVQTQFSFMPFYYISGIIDEFNVIINVPKLKTHELTKYTGAIKNMFGTVPGMCKPDVHRCAPGINNFSRIIVEIFAGIKPILNVMDAVYGMEGNGPSGGHPKKIGYILASQDAVALDAVCSYMIGYKVTDIITTVIGSQYRLGEMDINKIDTEGKDIKSLRIKDFKRPITHHSRIIPKILLKYAYSKIRVLPYINLNKCQRCLICIKHCPVSAIEFNNDIFKFDYDKCIECFSCHELCKYKAVVLKKNFLARIILRNR
ncbi:MAG: DUF362 domain-containing protein [Candidatus Firestonebacteria bacterium]|nr:DUF362 domain-containing protein [Candidatus Firestonebacteria bacterium]